MVVGSVELAPLVDAVVELGELAELYLRPGDVMEAEIEGVGVLRNPVVSWQDAHGEPRPPRVRW